MSKESRMQRQKERDAACGIVRRPYRATPEEHEKLTEYLQQIRNKPPTEENENDL